MRVPALELLADPGHDVAEVERARLLGHPRVEYHLEQKIPELAAKILERAALDRVGDLVSLLDRIRGDRREGLLEIPRAAGARLAEPGHDLE